MHELFHVYSPNTGLFLKTYNRSRGHPYAKDITIQLMEYGATNFEVILGNNAAIFNRDYYLRMAHAYAR